MARCLALVAAAGWVVLFSSVLGVRSVEVSGAALLSADQVRAAAGIRPGAPLARLDTRAIAARVEKVPAVRQAAVELSYPSTVRIRVAERVAVGFQRGDDGGPVLVDQAGTPFRAVDQPPAGLPELIVAAPDALRAAAPVSAALPPELLSQVASIGADSVNAVTLSLVDGRTVRWGAAAGAAADAAKAGLLVAVLGQPGSSFDISAAGIVVIR
ncbi:MAG: FtsQ-type POTRA domain-containing protein [Frankiaceae bacterium]|nr:FtsQ-type POTRA domain-containing protein [Frankiaceae bacterium]